LELAQSFGILGTRIEENDLKHLHAATKGHALWLNLLFAQLRNQRLTAANVNDLIGAGASMLDRHLLRSIWSNLSANEKEMVWTIATFTRPPDIDKIERSSDMTYQKCSRMIRSLIRLRMIIEINADGTILYDLHPIIRMKAKEECTPQKKKSLLEKVVIILSFGNWGHLNAIIMKNDSYTAEIDGYVECAEIALENSDFEKALDYIDKVSDGLLKYGEDAKFVELAIRLLQITDYDSYQIGIHPKLSSIYEDLVNVFLEQGEFDKVTSYLLDLDRSSRTIQQYIFHSRLMGYVLWFRNEFAKAIELFEVAKRRIAEKGERVPSSMEYNYALALRDGGRVDEALEFFLSQQDLSTLSSWDPDSETDLSSNAGNISRCYYLKGRLEESLVLCKKSVQYLKKGHKRQHRVNYGYGLLWIADIYVQQGNFVEARAYLEEAVETWKKFCPSRLDKIRQHVTHYPEGILKILPEHLL
jgi:tetratricopeptide (TPR) repeat protein